MRIHAAKRPHHLFIFLKRAVAVILGCVAAGRVNAWQMKQAPLMTQWAALVDTNAPLLMKFYELILLP